MKPLAPYTMEKIRGVANGPPGIVLTSEEVRKRLSV
jgi:hypothetical protein